MARKPRRRIRRAVARRGAFGGGGKGLGGLFSRPMIATIGGAAAAGVLVPMFKQYLPASWQQPGSIVGPAVVGFGGGYLLSRFLGAEVGAGFAAGVIGPLLGGMLGSAVTGQRAQLKGLGEVGNSDGVSYLPSGDGMNGGAYAGDDDMSGLSGEELEGLTDEELSGLGAYEPETVYIR